MDKIISNEWKSNLFYPTKGQRVKETKGQLEKFLFKKKTILKFNKKVAFQNFNAYLCEEKRMFYSLHVILSSSTFLMLTNIDINSNIIFLINKHTPHQSCTTFSAGRLYPTDSVRSSETTVQLRLLSVHRPVSRSALFSCNNVDKIKKVKWTCWRKCA